jgi:hypothetical protein
MHDHITVGSSELRVYKLLSIVSSRRAVQLSRSRAYTGGTANL